MTQGLVACHGCGGLVPDVDGPTHRYIASSPGCWAVYGELLAGRLPASPAAALAADAYAVQHPGVPGPQSTPSVWVHLVTLYLVLDGGWRHDQAVRIRKHTADSFARWPWLAPPPSMGPVTARDVEAAPPVAAADVVEHWVRGAWDAWVEHHAAVRARAGDLLR